MSKLFRPAEPNRTEQFLFGFENDQVGIFVYEVNEDNIRVELSDNGGNITYAVTASKIEEDEPLNQFLHNFDATTQVEFGSVLQDATVRYELERALRS